jgi:hypothetical protein
MESKPFDWQLPGRFVYPDSSDKRFFQILQWMEDGEYIRIFYLKLNHLLNAQILEDLLDCLQSCSGIHQITLAFKSKSINSEDIELCAKNFQSFLHTLTSLPNICFSLSSIEIQEIPSAFIAESSFGAFLNQCSNLTEFQFSYCDESELLSGINALYSLSINFPISLTLQSLSLSAKSVSALIILFSSKIITALLLDDVEITPQLLGSILLHASLGEYLKKLKISYRNGISVGEICQCLEKHLSNLSTLIEFSFSYDRVDTDATHGLFKCISQMRQLETLRYKFPFQVLGDLSKLRNLQALHLHKIGLGESEFIPPESLVELRLSFISHADEGQVLEDTLIRFLQKNKYLKLLQTDFFTLSFAKSLKEICLDQGILECLIIEEGFLDNCVVEVLARALSENCSLTELRLLDIEMLSQGFSHIGDSLRVNCNLETLELCAIGQDSDDPCHILEAVCESNKRLTSLALSYLPKVVDLTILDQGEHQLLEVDIFEPPKKFWCPKLEDNRKRFKEESRMMLIKRTFEFDHLDANVYAMMFAMAGI